MKAEINADGVLTVRAENELERYALQCWIDNYNPRSTDGRSVLYIDYGKGLPNG